MVITLEMVKDYIFNPSKFKKKMLNTNIKHNTFKKNTSYSKEKDKCYCIGCEKWISFGETEPDMRYKGSFCTCGTGLNNDGISFGGIY